MATFSLRVPEELAQRARAAAADSGRSLNAWIVGVIEAATDPETADSELARMRERLGRAGLLWVPQEPGAVARPPDEEMESVRERLGRGKPLSEYVSEGRGEE